MKYTLQENMLSQQICENYNKSFIKDKNYHLHLISLIIELKFDEYSGIVYDNNTKYNTFHLTFKIVHL